MLRLSGKLDLSLPDRRAGESPIDWMVRLGLAPDSYTAAEMLVLSHGWTKVLDEVLQEFPSEKLHL